MLEQSHSQQQPKHITLCNYSGPPPHHFLSFLQVDGPLNPSWHSLTSSSGFLFLTFLSFSILTFLGLKSELKNNLCYKFITDNFKLAVTERTENKILNWHGLFFTTHSLSLSRSLFRDFSILGEEKKSSSGSDFTCGGLQNPKKYTFIQNQKWAHLETHLMVE